MPSGDDDVERFLEKETHDVTEAKSEQGLPENSTENKIDNLILDQALVLIQKAIIMHPAGKNTPNKDVYKSTEAGSSSTVSANKSHKNNFARKANQNLMDLKWER